MSRVDLFLCGRCNVTQVIELFGCESYEVKDGEQDR